MKRKKIVLLVFAVAVAGLLFYLYAGHAVPQGQKPLVKLDAAAGTAPLRDAFNQSASSTRVLLLLSPT